MVARRLQTPPRSPFKSVKGFKLNDNKIKEKNESFSFKYETPIKKLESSFPDILSALQETDEIKNKNKNSRSNSFVPPQFRPLLPTSGRKEAPASIITSSPNGFTISKKAFYNQSHSQIHGYEKAKKNLKFSSGSSIRMMSKRRNPRIASEKSRRLDKSLGLIKGVSHGIKKKRVKGKSEHKMITKNNNKDKDDLIVVKNIIEQPCFVETPKSGNLFLKNEKNEKSSSVSYEIKGGQFIFTKAKVEDKREANQKPLNNNNQINFPESPISFEEESHDDSDPLLLDSLIENLSNSVSHSVIASHDEIQQIACETEKELRDLNDLSDASYFPIFSKKAVKDGFSDSSTFNLSHKNRNKNTNGISSQSNNSSSLVQMIIDAGQKKIGPEYCLICSTLYTVGHEDDEKHHDKIHNGFLDVIRFTRWKNENVVRHLPEFGRRIIRVEMSEGKMKSWEKSKLQNIFEMIDRAMGSETNLESLTQGQAYLYIADKKIVGLVLGETVREGYPMTPDGTSCNTLTSFPILIGISRIWVSAEYRRLGIASTLLDTLRSHFYSPLTTNVPINKIAFSATTPDGYALAAHYTQTPCFLTYLKSN